jgi:hypothetical protein
VERVKIGIVLSALGGIMHVKNAVLSSAEGKSMLKIENQDESTNVLDVKGKLYASAKRTGVHDYVEVLSENLSEISLVVMDLAEPVKVWVNVTDLGIKKQLTISKPQEPHNLKIPAFKPATSQVLSSVSKTDKVLVMSDFSNDEYKMKSELETSAVAVAELDRTESKKMSLF